MPRDLSRFDLAEMLHCGLGIRRAARGASTFEEAAVRINNYLFRELRDPGSGEPQLVLSRTYKTHPYGRLEPGQQALVQELLDDAKPPAELQCLCLLATAGLSDDWNDRRRSRGHQVIPLPSPEMIEQTPMVAALLRQLGVDLATIVRPPEEIVADLAGRSYGIFHVEEASASPFIPAQEDFVEPYGVRSVIGFGGALPTGSFFTSILFARVPVPEASASRFRGIALDVKSMLFSFGDDATFVPADPY